MSFEEAFEKTKLSWDKELKPYWRGNLNLEDISDFMVKTKKEIDKTNLFFALKYSTIPTLLIFIIAFNFKAETFGYLTLSIVFGLTFYTLIKYFSNMSSDFIELDNVSNFQEFYEIVTKKLLSMKEKDIPARFPHIYPKELEKAKNIVKYLERVSKLSEIFEEFEEKYPLSKSLVPKW